MSAAAHQQQRMLSEVLLKLARIDFRLDRLTELVDTRFGEVLESIDELVAAEEEDTSDESFIVGDDEGEEEEEAPAADEEEEESAVSQQEEPPRKRTRSAAK